MDNQLPRLGYRGRYPTRVQLMRRIFRPGNLIIAASILAAFLALQISFVLRTQSARAVTLEHLGRGVCGESQLTRVDNFYGNGMDRWTLRIPAFDAKFRMHTTNFEWNENRHIPPDAKTAPRDTWVGTCTLTPKTPWRQIDVLGLLGPIECKVFGDWHVETNR